MIVIKELQVNSANRKRVITFGIANTDKEKNDVFLLRYQVYSERGYIDKDAYPNKLEADKYDDNCDTKYFIAVLHDEIGEKVIGCIRLILANPLPTQEDFIFDEPTEIRSIPSNKRFEIGRLIVIPPCKEIGDYLPRGLVMIFLLNVVGNFALKNSLEGGYAFIKESLNRKLTRSGFPVRYITKYRQRYPQTGVLYKYFTQKEDPVIPIFFLTKSFYGFSQKYLSNKLLFDTKGDSIIFRESFLTNVLKILKIV